MDKEEVVYGQIGISVTQKIKELNNAICSNMNGPRDYHTKWSKSDRERQISYDITSMWNLIKMIQMKLFTNRKRLTDLEIKLMVTRGEMWGGSDKLGGWD